MKISVTIDESFDCVDALNDFVARLAAAFSGALGNSSAAPARVQAVSSPDVLREDAQKPHVERSGERAGTADEPSTPDLFTPVEAPKSRRRGRPSKDEIAAREAAAPAPESVDSSPLPVAGTFGASPASVSAPRAAKLPDVGHASGSPPSRSDLERAKQAVIDFMLAHGEPAYTAIREKLGYRLLGELSPDRLAVVEAEIARASKARMAEVHSVVGV